MAPRRLDASLASTLAQGQPRVLTGGHRAAHVAPCRVLGRSHGHRLEATLGRVPAAPVAPAPTGPAQARLGLSAMTVQPARLADRPAPSPQSTCRLGSWRGIPFAQSFASAASSVG